MKNYLVLLLTGLTVIIWICPSGQAVYLVSPSVSQLIKTSKKEQPSRQFPLVLKFYQLDMNSKFWTSYEDLTHHCLKINFFWSALQRTVNQIIIACLQTTFSEKKKKT